MIEKSAEALLIVPVLKAISSMLEPMPGHSSSVCYSASFLLFSRKLGAEEVVRQQVQSREALALERATAVEQEREKERSVCVCNVYCMAQLW